MRDSKIIELLKDYDKLEWETHDLSFYEYCKLRAIKE